MSPRLRILRLYVIILVGFTVVVNLSPPLTERASQLENGEEKAFVSCPPSLRARQKCSKLEFIHIPKTGGTALEALGGSHNISWGACHWLPLGGKCPRTSIRDYFHHPDWHFSSWHVPIQYYNTPQHTNELFQWFEDACLFAIVRNPYSRTVSEWNYAGARMPKGVQRSNITAMNEYLSNKVGKMLDEQKLSGYKWNRKGDHWVPQVEFVENVATNTLLGTPIDNSGQSHSNILNKHHSIQGYGSNHHEQRNVYILHYENISHDFKCLMETFGMNLTWPDKRKMKAVSSLTASNLTEKTKSLIAAYYAADFGAFGYEK